MKWLSLPAALLVLAACSTADADLLDRLTRVFDNEAAYEDAAYGRATPAWARGDYAEQYIASDANDGSSFNVSGFPLGHGHSHAFGGGYGCDGGCTPSCGRGCGHAKPWFGGCKPSFSFKNPCGFAGCRGECGSACCRQPRMKCCEPAGDCCGKAMNFQWLYGRNCKAGCNAASCQPATCGCGKCKSHGSLFGGFKRGCGCGGAFGGCSSCGDAGYGHYHDYHYGTPVEATPTYEGESQEPSLLPPPVESSTDAPSGKSATRWLMPSGLRILPVGMEW